MRALIIGAQPASLGWAITEEFEQQGYDVLTAGVSGHEDMELDCTNMTAVARLFVKEEPFNAVVNTAGINEPFPTDGVALCDKMDEAFATNVIGHMIVLQHWLAHLPETVAYWTNHYVSISSNSAHIARGRSLPYCASKAALFSACSRVSSAR
jgi:NAD(P)-dependent dehydrogenase (short-subunit alcohol dehydrogenase family)